MVTNKISTKTIARLAAIQTIYQYQHAQGTISISILMENMRNFYNNLDDDSELEMENGFYDNSLDSSTYLKLKTETGKPIKIKLATNHFNELVKFSVENLEYLDSIINTYLAEEWQLKDLQPLVLAIMRVAITELRYFPETPYKVVINEFSDLTNNLSSEHEVSFVNSALDKIAKNEYKK